MKQCPEFNKNINISSTYKTKNTIIFIRKVWCGIVD